MDVPGNINFPSTHLELFEDEKIELPYEKKTNFKIIEPASLTYVMDSSDDTVDVVYQQIEFDLSYSGTAGCTDRKVTYNENFGTLCTPAERTGYTFGGWKLEDGTVVTASTKNTYYNDIVLTPIWNGISYTITFYMGNGNKDTDGRTKLGDMQCVYGSNCKLLSFASFEKEFPYETYDPNLNGVFDYGWKYAGWTNYPDNTNVAYEDELEFVWNKDYNVSLYAMGKREFKLYSGLDSETNKAIRVLPESVEDMIQYWNPYSHDDDYLTEVKFPEGIEIDGWTFVGYRDGRSIVQGEPGIPSGNSKINSNLPSSISAKTFKPPVRTAIYIRTVYQRTLTLNYDLNEGSFTDGTKTLDSLKQTDTQYYNSGIAGEDKWTTPLITSVNFMLHPRTGIQKTGHTFDGWLEGSVSGDLKEVSSSYAFTPSITDNPTKTMYVKWTGCGAGQYLAENDNQCISCAAGTYSEGGVNSCSICPAGSYCPGSSDKVSCPSGTISGSGSTSPTECILYSCSSGTLTVDESLGYICVNKASSSVVSYECGSESCGTYEVVSSVDNCCFRCGGGYGSDYACCSACGTTRVTTTVTQYCTKYCYSASYYCPSGWTKYSGSGSTLKCYKAASS